jgi:hypothetical protein
MTRSPALLDLKADVVESRDHFVGPQGAKEVAPDEGALEGRETMPGGVLLIDP